MSDTGHESIAFHFDRNKFASIVTIGIFRAIHFARVAQSIELESLSKDKYIKKSEPFDDSYFSSEFFDLEAAYDELPLSLSEFQNWAIAQCLMEIESHFSLFLDEIFSFTFLARNSHCSVSKLRKALNDFSRISNVEKKLHHLYRIININGELLNYIHGFSLIRNCIAHSPLGVNIIHCNSKDSSGRPCIRLKWRIFQSGGQTLDGFAPLRLGIPLADQGFIVENGNVAIKVRLVERERFFAQGTQPTFCITELEEICFSFKFLAEKVLDCFVTEMLPRIQTGEPASS